MIRPKGEIKINLPRENPPLKYFKMVCERNTAFRLLKDRRMWKERKLNMLKNIGFRYDHHSLQGNRSAS
jgi:hypothetical protein